MMPTGNILGISNRERFATIAIVACLLLACASATATSSAYVRVNQAGYEAGNPPFQAYLMSTASESGATFSVINSEGQTVFSGPIDASPFTWSNKTLVYNVYPISFTVPGRHLHDFSPRSRSGKVTEVCSGRSRGALPGFAPEYLVVLRDRP
jgi:hypothetical protein